MSKDVLNEKHGVARFCRVRVRIDGRSVVFCRETCTQALLPILVPPDEPRWIDMTKSLHYRGPRGGPQSSRTYRHGSRQERRRSPVMGSRFWHFHFFVAIEEDGLETRAEGESGGEQPLIQRERPWPATAVVYGVHLFIYKPYEPYEPYDCHSAALTPYLDVGWFFLGSTPHTRIVIRVQGVVQDEECRSLSPSLEQHPKITTCWGAMEYDCTIERFERSPAKVGWLPHKNRDSERLTSLHLQAFL